MTTRTCSVWCPDWPIVAARTRDPDLAGVPVVVRERIGSRDLVRAASAEARANGVGRGMRRREAEARCPGVVVVEADLALEARTFESVARAVETITPRVVLDRPGRCAFPTRGPSRYFGGDHALGLRVRDVVGVDDVRVGIADGEFAAGLAARRAGAREPLVVEAGATAAFLAPWPVSVFDDDELASLLVRLGLHTLGSVAALPSDAVLARFGTDGREFHRLAQGLDTGPPVLVSPPPDLVEMVELDPPATRVDVAAFAAKRLADRLLERLTERGIACTRVLIEAETEHGERLTRCWRLDNTLTAGALAERVRWQLDGWLAAHAPRTVEGDVRAEQDLVELDSTTGALTLLRLVPDEVAPAHGRQLGFWGGDQAARDRADRALARVQGMLGYETVATAVVQGGRTPTEQVRWVPWGEPREPDRPLVVGAERPAWPGAVPPPYPARVFTPPVPAVLLDDRGRPLHVSGRGEASAAPARLECRMLAGGGGSVRAWAGPWAHDVRWWDPRHRRRRALWQIVIEGPDASEVACLVALEAGTAGIEAIYD
jgi:protein ImuB